MSSAVDILESEMLSLPAAARARLVEKLIFSLDADPDVEAAWAAESERRHTEIAAGTTTLLPSTLFVKIVVTFVHSVLFDRLSICRSLFSHTISGFSQLRVFPDHRSGLLVLACS